MKSRVIIRNQMYVPQIKERWWTSWTGICKGQSRSILGLCNEYDTMEAAVEDIKSFEKQKVDDGKVVWEGK